jgi:hypothetical protein
MAVISASGYFDDSRTDGKVCTVAGLVGSPVQWEQFESRWTLVLDRHGVPYVHMKEMADPSGPFKKWLPPQEHRDEIKGFFSDIAIILNECRFSAFGATVRIRDLQRFNAERGLELDTYALGVYGCMLHVRQNHPNTVIKLFFDRIEKVTSRLDKAQQYAEADGYYVGVTDSIQPIPLQRGFTFREVRPMQAADFLAWELRKHHIDQNEWWEIEDKPMTWDERFKHYQEWSWNKFGALLPPPRKSLNALLERIRLEGIVWDYRALTIAHNARGAIWSIDRHCS